MDWERIKQRLLVGYAEFAHFFLFQNMVGYVLACISARHPIGPAGYAAFLYRMFTFR